MQLLVLLLSLVGLVGLLLPFTILLLFFAFGPHSARLSTYFMIYNHNVYTFCNYLNKASYCDASIYFDSMLATPMSRYVFFLWFSSLLAHFSWL